MILKGCRVEKIVFSNCEWWNANVRETKGKGINISGSYFYNGDFEGINWREVDNY